MKYQIGDKIKVKDDIAKIIDIYKDKHRNAKFYVLKFEDKSVKELKMEEINFLNKNTGTDKYTLNKSINDLTKELSNKSTTIDRSIEIMKEMNILNLKLNSFNA